MPDVVNPQITDAVSPAHSELELAMQNAVNAQQNATTILQATTTQGVALIYSLVASSDAHEELPQQLERVQHDLEAAAQAGAGGSVSEQISGVIATFVQALQALNDVALRQAISTLAVAGAAVALTQIARAKTADQLAVATQMLMTVIREMTAWSKSV